MNRYKDIIIYIAIILLAFASVGLTDEQQADSSQTLDDIIVQETFEASFEEEKFPIHLNLKLSDVVKIPERINWESIDQHNIKKDEKNWQHFSFRLSSPQWANIQPAPVKVFKVQFKNLKSWKLDIFTSDGTLFRSMEGEKNPPKTIPWDGRGDTGEMMIPGHNYSYSFTPVDKAGNKRTFPGKSFFIPAVYSIAEDSLWIGIAVSQIFSYEGFGLLNTAGNYAKEVASLIRYYSKKNEIIVECYHPKSQDFIKLITTELGEDDKFIRYKRVSKKKDEHLVVLIE
jgi:hypothetical protein